MTGHDGARGLPRAASNGATARRWPANRARNRARRSPDINRDWRAQTQARGIAAHPDHRAPLASERHRATAAPPAGHINRDWRTQTQARPGPPTGRRAARRTTARKSARSLRRARLPEFAPCYGLQTTNPAGPSLAHACSTPTAGAHDSLRSPCFVVT